MCQTNLPDKEKMISSLPRDLSLIGAEGPQDPPEQKMLFSAPKAHFATVFGTSVRFFSLSPGCSPVQSAAPCWLQGFVIFHRMMIRKSPFVVILVPFFKDNETKSLSSNYPLVIKRSYWKWP